MELSIIIPTFNEAENISLLIDKVRDISENLDHEYEIIVVDGGSADNTAQIAKDKGVHSFIQESDGYGGALKDGIRHAKGRYIITMDADFSHNPYIIKTLFSNRDQAHIVIASRYVKGGFANMPLFRKILSVVLNKFLFSGLSLPVSDISSGFRLYDAAIFKEINFFEKNFNVLAEILVKAYMNGFTVKEIPFHYQPRNKGKSNAKVIKFGVGFLRTFFEMWKDRNVISSADYDERAFYSRIPFQRFWQRKRYEIICGFSEYTRYILDAGCGSSKILDALPQAIGLDINFKKLRYKISILDRPLVNADVKDLCFKSAVFDMVICSEVIEHLNKEGRIFEELKRVLKNNGILVLGTPDYSKLSWILIEWLYKRIIPGGYADEHISHYTFKELMSLMEKLGFKLEAHKYILNGELICKFRKTC